MREVGRLPLVTVIVPVYNTAAYVASCMESALRQTHRALEVVAVDDGSTDGSGAVLSRYARDPRVRIVSKGNGGLSSARNAALDVATGEYVCFLDSDDTLHDEAVERLLSVAVACDADFVRYDLQPVAPGAVPRPAPYPGESAVERFDDPFLEYVKRRFLPSACLCLYRRDAVGSLRFAHGQLFEDLDFTWRFLRTARSGAYVRWPAYNYTQTSCSITRSAATPRKFRSFVEALRRLDAFYREAGDCRLGLLRRKVFTYVVKAGIIKPANGASDEGGELLASAMSAVGELVAHGVVGPLDFSPRWWPWMFKARRMYALRRKAGA